MRAAARVVAVADGRGGTRLAVLRGDPPLVVRRTGPAEVHLVGGAAGPLGGDRLRLDIEVGEGAFLRLRTVAAAIALPGAGPSRMDVYAEVRGRLAWLPEPLIAASGCDHTAASTVELAADASLVWREELVCGRHGEEPGDARLSTLVRLGGRTLHRNELAVGPAAPGWSGAAVLGGARAVGAVLVVDPACSSRQAEVVGPTAAAMPLAGAGVLATATGPDLTAVRARLSSVLPTCEASAAR